MKRCCRCKAEKEEVEFCRDKSRRDGLNICCKICLKICLKICPREKRPIRENFGENKKRCSKCGLVQDEDEFHKWNTKCKSCKNDYLKQYHKKRYPDKKNEIKRKTAIYRLNNPDKVKIWNQGERKEIKDLTDSYLKRCLRHEGVPDNILNNDFVELKRLLIKTKREIKKQTI